MGKTGKWFRSFLIGKKEHKDKENSKAKKTAVDENPPVTPVSTPKEKRRWSFRRSSATAPANAAPRESTQSVEASPKKSDQEDANKDQNKPSVAEATAAAADAAAAAAEAAAALVRMTAAMEEAAAVKIQSVFRGYLARKALRALKGLVKLQALVRGHLVRKQATATLRCMQALVTLQARARAQRLHSAQETRPTSQRPPPAHRRSTHRDNRNRLGYHEMDNGAEENIKIVEMDMGQPRPSFKSRNHPQGDRAQYLAKQDDFHLFSPAPSVMTDLMSPHACSSHFDDHYSFSTAQSSPQCYYSYDYPLFPNYMANTESSRAKARSQSAPKQRPPDTLERQPSGKRRNVPRGVKMQRSSSHLGSAAKGYQYPWWSVKLDQSNVSLKDSECGSTSTVLTDTNYCRSLAAAYNGSGSRF